jgi:hypothetical protein
VDGNGDCDASHSSHDSNVHRKKKLEKIVSDKISDVHFSEDDEIDKKYVMKMITKEIKKVTKRLTICYDKMDELKDENKSNLNKFNGITASLEKYENRVAVCEKTLKFTNVMKPTLD